MTAAAAPGVVPVRRALLAAADKRGLYDLAAALDARGVALVARRDNFIAIFSEGGLETTLLTQQVPSLLDARLDTLYPEVHAAIAARSDDDEQAALDEAGLAPYDLVVAGPPAFAMTSARPDATLALAVDAIDPGGVALIRAAAAHHARVVIVVDPDDYPALIDELDREGGITAPTRLRLATRAFAATAEHDLAIAGYLADLPDDAARERDRAAPRARLPALVTGLARRAGLAVDDGGPDGGALYREPPPHHGIRELFDSGDATLFGARRVAGRARPLAVTAARDLDRALALVRELDGPAAVVARGDEPVAAAAPGDPLGALHHVLAFADEAEATAGAALVLSVPLTAPLAARLGAAPLAAILAPAIADDVRAAWPADGPPLLVAGGRWHDDGSLGLPPLAWRSLAGGLLVQEHDVAPSAIWFAAVVTARAPTDDERRDLELAARVVRHARAHALVVARAGGTDVVVGGQPDLRRALLVARVHLEPVLAGGAAAVGARLDDPLEVEALAAAGVRALWQPGGGARDQEVAAAADRHGLAMVVTGLERVRR